MKNLVNEFKKKLLQSLLQIKAALVPIQERQKKGRNCGSCLFFVRCILLKQRVLTDLLFLRYFALFLYSIVDQIVVEPDKARILIVLIDPVTNHADCPSQNEEAVE